MSQVKLTKSATALLSEILTATNDNGNGFVVLNAAATKALQDSGLIEVNEGVTNDKGEVGARITDAGRAQLETAPKTEPAKVKRSFAIESDIPLVEKARAPVGEQYPFSELQVGQSFFVADADVSSGNAFKTLNSTVSTANKRYAVDTGEVRPHRRNASKTVPVLKQERQFELRHFVQFEGTENEQKGARVYRVPVEA